ncbi:hypothetical protein L2E82_32831 [Cichorium intybus]|uniref:Uncharacterized protein n=1 Tax=Cichorium intybus TaxID=13427 RepID=A0ACB9BI75_CICIN|nr:hypothetical protein L2E82_32831 [Cichorium intybus]
MWGCSRGGDCGGGEERVVLNNNIYGGDGDVVLEGGIHDGGQGLEGTTVEGSEELCGSLLAIMMRDVLGLGSEKESSNGVRFFQVSSRVQ